MSKTLKYVLASPTTIMCNHVCIELTALSWFLQVGQDSMAGKEALVLKGLEAAQINIDIITIAIAINYYKLRSEKRTRWRTKSKCNITLIVISYLLLFAI